MEKEEFFKKTNEELLAIINSSEEGAYSMHDKLTAQAVIAERQTTESGKRAKIGRKM